MNLKKSFLLGALSLSLVLTGCGNGDKEENTDNNASTPATSTEENKDENKEEENKDEDTTGSGDDTAFTVVSREDGSGTRGAFIEIVGLEEKNGDEKVDTTTDEAVVQNSTNGVMQAVSQDPSAIGYISLGSLNDTVKAVKIDGVEATDQNIVDGKYPIARPFILGYYEDKLDDLGKDFIAFCGSKEAQDIVEEEGYIRVEDTGEYKAAGTKGNITVAGSTSVTPLMEKLIEKYTELNPDAKIELQSNGSSAGIESTMSGVSQIAMSSRDLQEGEDLKGYTLAQDGIAVVVNKDSSLEDISMDQLKQIFNGTIKTTGELK